MAIFLDSAGWFLLLNLFRPAVASSKPDKMKFIALFIFCSVALVCNVECAPSKPRAGGMVECNLCHWLAGQVESWLEDQKTEDWIINEIDVVCNTTIFVNYSKVCEAIVQFGVDEFVQFIENTETPEEVCGPDQLDLCSSRVKKLTFS